MILTSQEALTLILKLIVVFTGTAPNGFFIFLVLRIVYYIKHQIPPKLLLYGNNITIIAYNILFNNCILRNYSIIVILSFI